MEQSARRHEEDRYAYCYRPILCTRPTSVVRHKRNFRYAKKQVCLGQIACRSCRKGHGSVCWPLLRRELLEKPNFRNMARRACQPLQPHGNRDKCALRHTARIQGLVYSARARTLRLQHRREDGTIQNALCRPHFKSLAPTQRKARGHSRFLEQHTKHARTIANLYVAIGQVQPSSNYAARWRGRWTRVARPLRNLLQARRNGLVWRRLCL